MPSFWQPWKVTFKVASAASPELMQHTGRAVVFETIEDLHHLIDDDDLDIDETCIMVLKNCGPKGYPGMAEVGNMPLPQKLLRKGVRDMIRISDALKPAPMQPERGYAKLYIDHVLQADKGVDLDFLVGRTGSPVPRDNH